MCVLVVRTFFFLHNTEKSALLFVWFGSFTEWFTPKMFMANLFSLGHLLFCLAETVSSV